ncbi:MAG: DNA methyltransferase [Patescibacteria group bacterium]|jgi:tRNA (guanine10-N2)-dimethyltransferase
MATQYAFILGKNPILSVAEIFRRATIESASFTIVELTSQALIVQAGRHIDAAAWQAALGGCIKIGEIINTYDNLKHLLANMSSEYLTGHMFPEQEKKIIFGFSLYGDPVIREQKKFLAAGLTIKKALKGSGRSARLLTGKEPALSSVQVDKNNLLTRGADCLVIASLNKIYLGKTLTMQDYEDYSERDYGRPQRDARSGMLPPKLAKIMINLAAIPHDQYILDPFCGSGTILQEALAMGYHRVAGSDISSKAVMDTKQNLAWLASQRQLPQTDIVLDQADVRKLGSTITDGSVDAIITEPFLGPPLTPHTPIINILAIIQELESLYMDAFKTFSKILKPGGKIVIVFPLIKTAHGIFSLRILEQLTAMGFMRMNPIPDEASLFAKIGPTARGSILYHREGQMVEREIFIFQKKS